MIIDLTHTITPDMPVFPGSPQPVLRPEATITRNGHRETELQFVSHTGTHMDAPFHLLRDGSTLDVIPVSQFCGRAVALDVSDVPEGGIITAERLRAQGEQLLCADFVLLYTGWEQKWGTAGYFGAFPVPDAEASKYLVSCGLKGVGTDALSVDPLKSDDLPVHRALLGGGVMVVENLCLKKIAGRTDLMFYALPLKFEHADGAPVRAVAEFRDFPDKE